MPRELTADDRMQLRGIGDLQHPGCCLVCRNGTCEQGYIDLGTYFDYEGQMYVCIPCIIQAAETAGMLSPAELAFIIENATEQANQNEALKAELHEAKVRLSEYDTVIGSALKLSPTLSADAANILSSRAAENVNEEPEERDPEAVEPVSSADNNEPEPAEPGKGKGRTDVKFASGNDGSLSL